jgi:hypothetical protein
MLENIHTEYWLIQHNGEGKFGPFNSAKEAYECVRLEELSDYELKIVLSYVPF